MAEDQVHTALTLFLLMAQYNGQTVVPLDQVCRDFFGHLTVGKLLRKALRGDIALPIVRIETSQKATAACILSIWPPTSTSAGRRREWTDSERPFPIHSDPAGNSREPRA